MSTVKVKVIPTLLVFAFVAYSYAQIKETDSILDLLDYEPYFEEFNKKDKELYPHYVPNRNAIAFLAKNIPLLDIPDSTLRKTYYFRWWTFRKHIKITPQGGLITEFLPDVDWAGEYNTISAPTGHQVIEGRWLRNKRYKDNYIDFWYSSKTDQIPKEHLFSYSNWLGYAVWKKFLVDGDKEFLIRQLPGMVASFEHWEKTHSTGDNLYWSYDVRDGMEESISG